MPYWSSSRVGVAVDGPPAKSRSARKGITMEDLKKQTALRLSQEQGRSVETPLAEPSPARPRYSSRGGKGQANPTYHQNRGGTPDRQNNSQVAHSPPPQSRSFPSPADHRQPTPNVSQPPQRSFHEPPHHAHLRPAPPNNSLISASRSVDSAAEKGSNCKLPHGLTVHELKEMTKARLAAERGVAPTTTSVPTTVQVSADPNMYQQHHPQARSPFPGETAEAWDTASVSTSASDYAASLNGTASFNGDETTMPFGRSLTYPNGSDWSDLYQAPLAENSYAPNRRRAVTLSPRPGLVNVNEYRPVLHPPSLPMEMNMGSARNNNNNSCVGPLGRQPHAPFPQQQQQQQFPEFMLPRYAEASGNRTRTSSAVSLPCISHTAEEFGGEQKPSPMTSLRFSSQFDSVHEDAAVTGLSDVFRGTSPIFDSICGSSLQGFVGSGTTTPTLPTNDSSVGLASSGSTSFGGSRMRAATTTSSSDFALAASTSSSDFLLDSDPRHRAATWSEPTLDLFCGQDLSEDLASILKLSGAAPTKEDAL